MVKCAICDAWCSKNKAGYYEYFCANHKLEWFSSKCQTIDEFTKHHRIRESINVWAKE